VRESEEMLRLSFDAMQEGLIVQRDNETVEWMNPAARRILGMDDGELDSAGDYKRRFAFLREDGTEMPNDERPSRIAFLTGLPRRDVVMGIHRPGHDILWLSTDSVPLTNPDKHKVVRVVTTFSDITSRLASEQQLKALATTDGLTGIKNHRAFHERLSIEISRAIRYNHGLALIMIDVDHFKSFNDTFGHPAGDTVLASVASILEGHARATDLAARYGGEEFAVILPETDSAGASALAERIRLAIEQAQWEHRPITVSVGVAFFSLDLADASNFVARADRALYRAKAQGRNQVCVSRRGITPAHTNPAD
jgi:diguanylate cyclase (GGDEF)-like protein/PAS domain S-box-containing protein